MKPQSTASPTPEPEFELIVDSHGPWANGWHPAWDSTTDPSNSGSEVQADSADHQIATKSPQTSGTPPEEQRG